MEEKRLRANRSHRVSIFKEYAKTIVYVLIFAFIIRQFVVQAFRIPSGSMEDTLLVGDFLLVNKFIYGASSPDRIPFTSVEIPHFRLPALREPRSGDIIVFRCPRNPYKDFIKRVIAIEGQTVEIKDKVVYVNGKRVPDPPKSKRVDPRIFPAGLSNRDNFGPVRVPPGMVFVMGDNRDNSYDSRYWGWVPKENIKGKAMIIYFSWNRDAPLWDIIHKIRWRRIGNLIR